MNSERFTQLIASIIGDLGQAKEIGAFKSLSDAERQAFADLLIDPMEKFGVVTEWTLGVYQQ